MVQKKSTTPRAAAPQFDSEILALTHDYELGNFHAARTRAKRILARSDASDSTKAAAHNTLKKTGIDPLALLVGFLSALFTTIVAFVVGA